MFKIESILNPSASPEMPHAPRTGSFSTSPPSTPAYATSGGSPSSFTSRSDTPDMLLPAKRPKLIKDAAVFVKGEAKGKVNYPPYEVHEHSVTLSHGQHEELLAQHQRFQIYPSGMGAEGLISDFVKHIPYSSEKKGFSGKTGCEGFDVYQYTFIVPGDATQKKHTVMWDYNNGLVRVTPFFKACKFSKTTPAKALNANEGLKELSHSITGGALVAQGYWMPYPCARAICLTFAHDIRWALTPIFGPSFIRECLHPTDLGSQRWKIDPEVIRIAKMDVEGWLSSEVPIKEEKGIPRSVPVEHQEEVMRQKPAKPTFKQGSPFDGSDSGTSEISNPYGLATPHPLGSPEISPRSSTFPTTSWATINRPNADRSSPPSPPQNSPVGSLSNALLNEPGFPQWRAAENTNVEHNTAPTSSGNKRARRPSIDGTYADSAFGNYSDEMDVDASPPARGALGSSGHGRVGRHPPEQWRGPLPDGKSKVVTVEAVRAAQCLVQLAGNNPSFGNVKTEF